MMNKQHLDTGRIDLGSFRLKELHEKTVMEIEPMCHIFFLFIITTTPIIIDITIALITSFLS